MSFMDLSNVRSYVNDFSGSRSDWARFCALVMRGDGVVYDYVSGHMDSDVRFSNWRKRMSMYVWLDGVMDSLECFSGDMIGMNNGFMMDMYKLFDVGVLDLDYVMYMRYVYIRMTLELLLSSDGIGELEDALILRLIHLNELGWKSYLESGGDVSCMFNFVEEYVELCSLCGVSVVDLDFDKHHMVFDLDCGDIILGMGYYEVGDLLDALCSLYCHEPFCDVGDHFYSLRSGMDSYVRVSYGYDVGNWFYVNRAVVMNLVVGLMDYYFYGELFLPG